MFVNSFIHVSTFDAVLALAKYTIHEKAVKKEQGKRKRKKFKGKVNCSYF